MSRRAAYWCARAPAAGCGGSRAAGARWSSCCRRNDAAGCAAPSSIRQARLAHARGHAMRRCRSRTGEIADELARTGDGDAPLECCRAEHDLGCAAQHEEGRVAGSPREAVRRAAARTPGSLSTSAAISSASKALEERQDRQERAASRIARLASLRAGSAARPGRSSAAGCSRRRARRRRAASAASTCVTARCTASAAVSRPASQRAEVVAVDEPAGDLAASPRRSPCTRRAR